MNKTYPTVRKSNFTGDAGVNLVSSIINSNFQWLFRPNHNETDFGIDAYIDVVSEDGLVLGISFAVQIKAGESFFKQETPNGFTFYGEEKHLDYYLNHQIPVFIIICDLKKRQCFWINFDKEKIEETKKGWKINIPAKNKLTFKSKEKILSLLPKVKSHKKDLEAIWQENRRMQDAEVILFTIDRKSVEVKDIKPLKVFFNRLKANDNLFRSCQGKVAISLDGYEEDSRELAEIKSVRKFFKKAEKKIDSWFFFLASDLDEGSLQLLMFCICFKEIANHEGRITKSDFEKISAMGKDLPRFDIMLNTSEYEFFIERNFLRQNKISKKLGLTEEENSKITKQVLKSLFLGNLEKADLKKLLG